MKKSLFCFLTGIAFLAKSQTNPLCFGQPAGYIPNGLGSFPITAVSADLNNDGKKDLAVANMSTNNVSVLLGTGLGTFSAAVSYAAGNSPQGVSAGDFNGDGNKDLAVTNYGSNNVSVLLGSATGTFAAAVNYSVGTTPVSVLSQDLNGDGHADLAVCYSSSHVAVLLGSGTGTFSAPASYLVGSQPREAVSADFNGDGYADLATANRFGSNVSVLLGSATGVFGTAVNFGVGSYPEAVVASDFNGDGAVDLAVSNFNSANVSVLLGNGSGSFGTAVNYNVGTSPYDISLADFNADGKTDLAVPNYNSNNISVLLGSGTGTFAGAANHNSAPGPYKIVADDFNSDGKTDMATTHAGLNYVDILFNSIPQPTITVNSGSICIGQSFTLSPGGATTYTFTGGSAVVSPTSSTSYSVTGTNIAGCVSQTAAVSNITVVPSMAPVVSVSGGSICAGQSFTISPSGADTYSFSGGSAVVSPSASTNYSVVGSYTSSGCKSNAAYLSVAVHTLPVVSVASGSICAGQSFTLNPSGAASYSYSGSSSAVVSPSVTASYGVVGVSSAGCVSQAPAIANVIVYPLPVLSVNSGSICPGQSFTITPGGAATYTFINGASVVSPLVSTSYMISGSSAMGCAAASVAISTVTVRSLPVIAVNSGAVCLGKSFTLSPSGAQTYTYSGGGPVVTPTINTTYSVTGADAFGCVSAMPAISNVVVNPLPVFTVSGNYSVCAGLPLTQLASGSAVTYTWSNGVTGNLVTMTLTSASSVYTVTGTDANNCKSSVTRSITVYAPPLLSINSTQLGVCPGRSVALSGGGANSYAWSGGITDNMPFYPSTTTTYTLTGTDAFGCINKDVITITVYALPALSASSTQSLLCHGETATLSAAGAATYTWNTGASTQFITVNPMVTTTYSLSGTDVNGCSNSAVITQSVDACLGVDQLAGASWQLLVYPNPSHGEFVIETERDLTVTITNAPGQVILQKQISAGRSGIDLSSFPEGLYFLRFTEGGTVATVKLIRN